MAAGDLGFRESNVYHHALYQLGAGTAILNADRLGIGECNRSLVDPGCRCLLKNGKITDARARLLMERDLATSREDPHCCVSALASQL